MRHAILIYNPTAGRGGQQAMLDDLRPSLRRGGVEAEPRATAGPGDATDLAAKAAAEGLDAVFVLGGDGTVREAAAGLVGGSTPLAILPGGTTNVLAHSLGLPPTPRAAATAHGGFIAQGPGGVRHLDVGRCAGHPFLMMASGGYDAFLLKRMDPTWKARFGKLGIALQGLLHLGRYRYPAIRLRLFSEAGDEEVEEIETRFFAVCNIPFYAGTFVLCPSAALDDGRLDLVTFTGSGPVATAGFSLDIARGLHVDRDDVTVRPVSRLEIVAPEALPLQIDGDALAAEAPVVVELAAETVPVLAPAASAAAC